jgi:hypothetical protein
MPGRVRPPDGFTSSSDTPIASEPPVKSWFTTTVPLRDPEELLNNYLTGRAEGVGGAIKNPLGSIAKRNGSTIGKAPSQNGTGSSGADAVSDAGAPGGAPVAPIDRAQGPRPDAPAAPPLTSSGLPTRIPRSNLPTEQPFDAFGSGSAPAATPAPTAEPAPSTVPVPEPVALEPVAPEPGPTETTEPRGPVLDPLIAELAADVLNAPSAEEALAEADGEENGDDSSIFASLQSEWFTRRTPLEARRTQPDAAEDAAEDGTGWVSPGDEGWRRAAELAEPAADEQAPVTAGGLPVRVPGRNLVPGSAAAAPVIPASAENVVPMPRLERRRTRGLSSFQQGVSRARTTDSPESAVTSEEITVPDAFDASANRANEEQQ